MAQDLSDVPPGKIVRIDRSRFPDRYTTGYLLGHTDQLIMVHQFHDYVDFGVVILRTPDVTEMRMGEHEEAFHEILAHQGYQPAAPGSRDVPLDSWSACLRHLAEQDAFVSIECEEASTSEEETQFSVGIPSEVEDGTLWLLSCSPLGRWEAEEEAIEIRGITSLQLNSPYLDALHRFVTGTGSK